MSVTALGIGRARQAELESLVVGGKLSPERVVEFARNPNTALHGIFEWDDTAAAEEYRRVQARQYIRAVAKVIRVEGSDEPMKVRAWVSLQRDRSEGVYRSLAVVMEDPELREEALAQAVAEFQAFKTKHQHLSALARFFQVAEKELPRT